MILEMDFPLKRIIIMSKRYSLEMIGVYLHMLIKFERSICL